MGVWVWDLTSSEIIVRHDWHVQAAAVMSDLQNGLPGPTHTGLLLLLHIQDHLTFARHCSSMAMDVQIIYMIPDTCIQSFLHHQSLNTYLHIYMPRYTADPDLPSI